MGPLIQMPDDPDPDQRGEGEEAQEDGDENDDKNGDESCDENAEAVKWKGEELMVACCEGRLDDAKGLMKEGKQGTALSKMFDACGEPMPKFINPILCKIFWSQIAEKHFTKVAKYYLPKVSPPPR